jgi:hypothetical protein
LVSLKQKRICASILLSLTRPHHCDHHSSQQGHRIKGSAFFRRLAEESCAAANICSPFNATHKYNVFVCVVANSCSPFNATHKYVVANSCSPFNATHKYVWWLILAVPSMQLTNITCLYARRLIFAVPSMQLTNITCLYAWWLIFADPSIQLTNMRGG